MEFINVFQSFQHVLCWSDFFR